MLLINCFIYLLLSLFFQHLKEKGKVIYFKILFLFLCIILHICDCLSFLVTICFINDREASPCYCSGSIKLLYFHSSHFSGVLVFMREGACVGVYVSMNQSNELIYTSSYLANEENDA